MAICTSPGRLECGRNSTGIDSSSRRISAELFHLDPSVDGVMIYRAMALEERGKERERKGKKEPEVDHKAQRDRAGH